MTDPITETVARATYEMDVWHRAIRPDDDGNGRYAMAGDERLARLIEWDELSGEARADVRLIAAAAIAAHKDALSTAGLVIVPREPDSDMLNAGANALDDGDTPGVMTAAEVCYAAMIAASEKEGT